MMQLPDGFENRRFSDWNCLVRGLLEVWEIAHTRGQEKALEEMLAGDRDGAFTEILGRLGYACATASALHLAPADTGLRRSAPEGDLAHLAGSAYGTRVVRPVFAIITQEPIRRENCRNAGPRRVAVERRRADEEGGPL